MHMYIPRKIESEILRALHNNPVVAITGPRQCGKSTLARHLAKNFPSSIYLDMERPSDLQKMENAEWFLGSQRGKLICIDEIQRVPEVFPLMRSLVDEWGTNGAFLVLGSASHELLMQSSESLAGRISYKRLTPFLWDEIASSYNLETYLSRGGFPRSIMAADNLTSVDWRADFVTTFLERDLLFWRSFTPATMRRLWQMLAHVNGQTTDYTTLAKSLGLSSATIKQYIDLLESTFMLEVVPACHSNLGKRLVKAPKLYISDSGISTALLGLNSFEALAGHPALGSVWEQVVLSNLKGTIQEGSICFYRTQHGAEIDFVLQTNNGVFAVECKASLTPALTRGNHHAIADIQPQHTFVAAPVAAGWPVNATTDVVSLAELTDTIRNIQGAR